MIMMDTSDILNRIYDEMLDTLNIDLEFDIEGNGKFSATTDSYVFDYENEGTLTVYKHFPVIDEYTGNEIGKETRDIFTAEIIDPTGIQMNETMQDMLEAIKQAPASLFTKEYIDK